MSTTARYQVIEGSVSSHCCFTHTVVDTTKPYKLGHSEFFESICECFTEADATLVCNALNAASPIPQ
jgi:hypothetical protein